MEPKKSFQKKRIFNYESGKNYHHRCAIEDPHGRLVGDPQILVGDPQILVGGPQILVGDPQILVGNPQILVGIANENPGFPIKIWRSPTRWRFPTKIWELQCKYGGFQRESRGF